MRIERWAEVICPRDGPGDHRLGAAAPRLQRAEEAEISDGTGHGNAERSPVLAP